MASGSPNHQQFLQYSKIWLCTSRRRFGAGRHFTSLHFTSLHFTSLHFISTPGNWISQEGKWVADRVGPESPADIKMFDADLLFMVPSSVHHSPSSYLQPALHTCAPSNCLRTSPHTCYASIAHRPARQGAHARVSPSEPASCGLLATDRFPFCSI
jgi:hypothetical protein